MDKDLLNRMKSIRQTVQISGAQKLVAASQIGKARKMLEESEPYHSRIIHAIANMLQQCPELVKHYDEADFKGSKKKRGLLVFAANHGLAGSFNSNIVHFTKEYMEEKPVSYIIVLGQACRNHLIQEGYPVDKEYFQPLDPPSMFTARELAEKIMDMIESGKVDAFNIIYTHYKSSVRMDPMCERLYPINYTQFVKTDDVSEKPYFEPSPQKVLESMVIKYIKGFIYGCLVDTWRCELTSRVTAMDNAIRNGNEMLDKLSLLYNRARQASITQEITEIVAGAAALMESDD